MLLALVLFVSDRLRPDAVALIVLLLAWMSGLVSLEAALAGFGSPAVLIVAAVLVVGRAVEYTGGAQAMLFGWRLAPRRVGGGDQEVAKRVLTFELGMPIGSFQGKVTVETVRRSLRTAGASLPAVLRDGERARLEADARLRHDDRSW